MSVRTLTSSVSRKAGTAQSAPEKARGFWVVLLISWLYGILVCSLRIRLQDPARLLVRAEGAPHIFVFWHNRLLLIPLVWQRFLSTNRPVGVALISASRDGELMTRFLGRFGLTAVRGSGSKRGSTALRELAGWIRRGHDVGITPDGSRGPCYQVKPGLVLLAQLTGRPLLPITLEYSSAWRMRSWDRFFIPKPFSRVTFIVGEPLVIRRTSNLADFESERQRCEAVMCAQVSTL